MSKQLLLTVTVRAQEVDFDQQHLPPHATIEDATIRELPGQVMVRSFVSSELTRLVAASETLSQMLSIQMVNELANGIMKYWLGPDAEAEQQRILRNTAERN